MKLEFNGNELKLDFSIGTLKKVDQVFSMKMGDLSIGQGLYLLTTGLQTNDPITLYNFLKCSLENKHNKTKHLPKNDDEYTDFINDICESEEGIESICDQILEELGKQPMTRKFVQEK